MFSCLSPSKLGIDRPWPETAQIARDAGFAGIEVPLDPQTAAGQYQEVLARYGLRAGGALLQTAAWRTADPGGTAEAVKDYAARAKLLVQLGSNRFHTWVAPASDTLNYRDNFKWHVERLTPFARALGDEGCILALEFLGPHTLRVGKRFSFIHTIQQMLDLCAAIGPNVNLLLDSWHWHTSLSTIEDLRQLTREQVGYVHVNDAPAGIPIEQLQDLERALPATTGVIDLGAFIAELRRMNYDGPIVAEPFDATLKQLDPLEAARRGSESIQRMFEQEPHPQLPPTMQVLAMSNRSVRIVEAPTPRPVGNQVIVKLHASLICGSNMHQFHGAEEKINGGHEGAGQVVAVATSHRLRVGDRVALAPVTACGNCVYCRRGDVILCRNRPAFDGNFAQYTRVADIMCIKLPDDISYEHGSLLGCGLGPPYGALKTLNVRAFDTLVVSGLGPVGLGVCALATFMGVRVLGVDPEPYRRGVAERLGVDRTFDSSATDLMDQLRDAIGGFGMLKGIECSGRPEAERLLIDLAAPNGAIAFIGENKGTIPLSPSNDMIRKNLTIHGVWHMNIHDADDLVAFLRRCPQKADLLLTHRFPFQQAQQAFETFASRQAVKVALCPQA